MELIYSDRHPVVKRKVLQIQLPAIKAIWKSDLSQAAKITFSVIHAHTNRDNSKSFPSVTTLAECACASRKRIRAGIQELEKAGYLKVTTSSGGKYIFNISATVTVETIREDVLFEDPSIPLATPGRNDTTSSNQTTTNDNRTSTGPIVPPKVLKKAGVKERTEEGQRNAAPPSDIKTVYDGLSLKAKPIMLQEIQKAAKDYKKAYKADGNWTSDSKRQNFIKLRDFLRYAETLTYGCRISTF
jgi:hypothetical protein